MDKTFDQGGPGDLPPVPAKPVLGSADIQQMIDKLQSPARNERGQLDEDKIYVQLAAARVLGEQALRSQRLVEWLHSFEARLAMIPVGTEDHEKGQSLHRWLEPVAVEARRAMEDGNHLRPLNDYLRHLGMVAWSAFTLIQRCPDCWSPITREKEECPHAHHNEIYEGLQHAYADPFWTRHPDDRPAPRVF